MIFLNLFHFLFIYIYIHILIQGSYFYIGGRNINRYIKGGDWGWIKHGKMTKMTYFAFDSSEPNGSFSSPEDCMFFHGARGYLLHNACCDCYAAGFICEK